MEETALGVEEMALGVEGMALEVAGGLEEVVTEKEVAKEEVMAMKKM